MKKNKHIYEFKVEVPIEIKDLTTKKGWRSTTHNLIGKVMTISNSEKCILTKKTQNEIKKYIRQEFNKRSQKDLAEEAEKRRRDIKCGKRQTYYTMKIVPYYEINNRLDNLLHNEIKFKVNYGNPEIQENKILILKNLIEVGEFIDFDNIKLPKFTTKFYHEGSLTVTDIGLCISQSSLEKMLTDGTLPREFLEFSATIPKNWYRKRKRSSIILPDQLKKDNKIQEKIVKKLIKTEKNFKMFLEESTKEHCFGYILYDGGFYFNAEELLFYSWNFTGKDNYSFEPRNQAFKMALSSPSCGSQQIIGSYSEILESLENIKQNKINKANEEFNPVIECLESLNSSKQIYLNKKLIYT
ncbi:hypothetical protein ACFL1H_01175 [Nanoarchaeota archaeon]